MKKQTASPVRTGPGGLLIVMIKEHVFPCHRQLKHKNKIFCIQVVPGKKVKEL